MSVSWVKSAVFYHVYPLGALGAPRRGDLLAPPVERLSRLQAYIPHWKRLGVNALYLGPLFASTAHGYDTADYFHVDRRLGSDDSLRALVRALHSQDIRVILDGVFHHVGRDFWAFRDLIERGPSSPYKDWFSGVRFDARSPLGDPFRYDPWEGHYELVKLNLEHEDVRNHLLHAVQHWFESFEIDGLRLDVAEIISPSFLRALSEKTRHFGEHFWLMGEMIHGDYRRIAGPEMLHSATNYELYKGLWSSLNDKNFFELAHSVNRQSGANGVYQDLSLYTFVDNHDVTRAASVLKDPRHLAALYLLLFTLPGVPSIYYGSEWSFTGTKTKEDVVLRPPLPAPEEISNQPQEMVSVISRLSALRKSVKALQEGTYHELKVRPERFAFLRESATEKVLVVINAAPIPEQFEIPGVPDGLWEDLLQPQEQPIQSSAQRLSLHLPPGWGRVLRLRS
jgi:cyclomaltodextrinase